MRGLLNHEKIIVGYDLGEDYSQISYCPINGEVETLSMVAGEGNYNIPTVLCKRQGVNQWFFGKEALRYAEENQGILVENLLQLAVDGEPVQIDGTVFNPVALLTLYVKRSLGMLAQIASSDKIEALMITCERMNSRMLEVLNQVVAGLKLKTSKVCFQGHSESFFQFMLRQPEELWEFQVLLCDYRGNRMKGYCLESNRRTTPVVVYIDSREYPFTEYDPMPEEEPLRKEKLDRMDREFLELLPEICGDARISSVYLIGENYEEEWLKESLRYLCAGRRVFMGTNLYSKGACYGMQERLCPSETGQKYVFLGRDKLKANVGMKVLRRGQESYFALLDAGINWFEAEQTMECYLQENSAVDFVITPLIGKQSKTARMVLEDFQGELSRLKIHLFMKEENRMVVEITDLGLGVIRPGTGRVWREEVNLYE